MSPYRKRHYACIHPETFKYFFAREQIDEVWETLTRNYGTASVVPGFGVTEIQAKKLILRAAVGGNPITVIRTRHCTPEDVDAFHRLIGFNDS